MSGSVDLQALLRFLTKDAKIPLATAMSRVKDLQQAQLVSPDTLSKAPLATIQTIFPDEKQARAVLNAAKRQTKKRSAGETTATSSSTATTPSKRRRTSLDGLLAQTPAELEDSLSLPVSDASAEDLADVVLSTNRAPLLLALACTAVSFTMPEQPMSGRLSLAQAVVSAGAKAKAAAIGLGRGGVDSGDEWARGQAKVRVLGREVVVLRRWGYEWRPEKQAGTDRDSQNNDKTDARVKRGSEGDADSVADGVKVVKQEDVDDMDEAEPALWALDLEQMAKMENPLSLTSANHSGGGTTDLPVFSPHSARSYLLRSFETTAPVEPDLISSDMKKEGQDLKPKAEAEKDAAGLKPKSKATKTKTAISREKEENLALLLKALDLLFSSWAPVLSKRELDQKAWSWYLRIRPEVEEGVRGWGAKGNVKLRDILELRRKGGESAAG